MSTSFAVLRNLYHAQRQDSGQNLSIDDPSLTRSFNAAADSTHCHRYFERLNYPFEQGQNGPLVQYLPRRSEQWIAKNTAFKDGWNKPKNEFSLEEGACVEVDFKGQVFTNPMIPLTLLFICFIYLLL
jgi:hypothetical protein